MDGVQKRVGVLGGIMQGTIPPPLWAARDAVCTKRQLCARWVHERRVLLEQDMIARQWAMLEHNKWVQARRQPASCATSR